MLFQPVVKGRKILASLTGEKPTAFPELGCHPTETPLGKHLLSTPEPGSVLGELPLCARLHECLLCAMPEDGGSPAYTRTAYTRLMKVPTVCQTLEYLGFHDLPAPVLCGHLQHVL